MCFSIKSTTLLFVLAHVSWAVAVPMELQKLYDQQAFVNLNFEQRKQTIDSLYENIEQLDETQQLQFLFLASQTLKHQTTQQVVNIINQGLALADKLKDNSKSLYFAMLKLRLSPQARDITYHQQVAELKARTDQLPDGIEKAMAYISYARINDELEKRFEQLSALHQGIDVIEAIRFDVNDHKADMLLGELYNDLGSYYSDVEQYKKSAIYFNMALKFFTESNYQSKVGIVKFNLALLAYEERHFDVAVANFTEGIALKEQLKERYGLALSHMYLGLIKNEIKQPQQAIAHLNVSIPLLLELNKKYRLAFAYLYLSQSHHALSQFRQADEAILQSLAYAETHLPEIQRSRVFKTALEILSHEGHDEKKQQITAALVAMQASVYQSVKRDLNARVEAEVKLGEQQHQVKLLAQKTEIQRVANTLQKKWIVGLILLVVGLVYSIYRQIKVNQEKTVLANTDHLTGIYNRRFFYQSLEKIYAQKYALNNQQYLFLFDIDYFKSINDQFGHSTGDWVLVEMCRLINRITQPCCGQFARVGGEEFALVCRFEDLNAALGFANKIRKHVANHQWKKNTSWLDVNITISVGVTKLNDSLTAEELVNRADQALYRAKRNGRNRVEISQILPGSTKHLSLI